MTTVDKRHFQNSTYREKLVEHLFIGELLRRQWVSGAANVDILKPEVDISGYDVVVANGALRRHIQLKASIKGAKPVGRVSGPIWRRTQADASSGSSWTMP